ncbi:MAG TPA: hypothetical protein DCP28_04200, partial [Cytophagales bacterium]|nr:hypothetical protein [Cytophagales bacterium]
DNSSTAAAEPTVIGYDADGLPVFGFPGDPLPPGITATPPTNNARAERATTTSSSSSNSASEPSVIGYDAEGLPVFGQPGDPLPAGATINPPSDGAVAGNTNGRNPGNTPTTTNRTNNPTSASNNDPQVIGYDAEGLPIFGLPGDPLPAGATINPPSGSAVAGNTNGRNAGNNPATTNRTNNSTSAS